MLICGKAISTRKMRESPENMNYEGSFKRWFAFAMQAKTEHARREQQKASEEAKIISSLDMNAWCLNPKSSSNQHAHKTCKVC